MLCCEHALQRLCRSGLLQCQPAVAELCCSVPITAFVHCYCCCYGHRAAVVRLLLSLYAATACAAAAAACLLAGMSIIHLGACIAEVHDQILNVSCINGSLGTRCATKEPCLLASAVADLDRMNTGHIRSRHPNAHASTEKAADTHTPIPRAGCLACRDLLQQPKASRMTQTSTKSTGQQWIRANLGGVGPVAAGQL